MSSARILILVAVAALASANCRPSSQADGSDNGSGEAITPLEPTPDLAAEGSGAPAAEEEGSGDETREVVIDAVLVGVDGQAFEPGPLVVYCAIDEVVMAPIFARYTDETGVDVLPVYGTDLELRELFFRDYEDTPADVYIAGNPVDAEHVAVVMGLLAALPGGVARRVHADWRGYNDRWVGVFGRLVGFAYRTDRVAPDELPASYLDVADARWQGGRIGWAPNSDPMRWMLAVAHAWEGYPRPPQWVQGVVDNEGRMYDSQAELLDGLAQGEVDIAVAYADEFGELTDRYGSGVPLGFHRIDDGSAGSFMQFSIAAVVRTTLRPVAALGLVDLLTSPGVQRELGEQAHVVPLAGIAHGDPRWPELWQLQQPHIQATDIVSLSVIDTVIAAVLAGDPIPEP